MRFAEVGQNIPVDASWATTLKALPDAVFHALHYTEFYLHAHLSTAGFVAAGLAGAFFISSDSVLTPIIRLAPIVYLITIVASPVFTDFRYELTLLPTVAIGVALLIDKAIPFAASRLPQWFESLSLRSLVGGQGESSGVEGVTR